MSPGAIVRLEFLRDGRSIERSIVLGDRPSKR
jgi:hypothetical protein